MVGVYGVFGVRLHSMSWILFLWSKESESKIPPGLEQGHGSFAQIYRNK